MEGDERAWRWETGVEVGQWARRWDERAGGGMSGREVRGCVR